MRRPEELSMIFRQRGLRITPQRQLLFDLLFENDTHPSADSLYAEASARLPGIALRTVYQTLTDLEALGELRALCVGAGATRFDPNTSEHHHVVCDRCGAIRDVLVAGDAGLRPLGAEPGFRLDRTQVVFRGVCVACVPLDDRPADEPVP